LVINLNGKTIGGHWHGSGLVNAFAQIMKRFGCKIIAFDVLKSEEFDRF